MSGFAGIIRLEPTLETAEADRAAIARMAQAIAFRGPDAQQHSSKDGASFAFSLLTTGPAPQATSQPVTLDGTGWLIGDIRLDRRTELIKLLASSGRRCEKDVTDEEIALQAWKCWREDGNRHIFFEELYGEFSFAIWEPARREVNCFRDLIGCRPFFYSFMNGNLSFSNTIDALRYAPDFSQELDRQYIGDFLLYGACLRPELTVYRNIRRLPAGHHLRVSHQGLISHRYQQLPIEEPLFLKHKADYVDFYRDLLERAVADRLPGGPAAIFLSGGMDSSSLAATVAALRAKAHATNDLYAVTGDMQPLFDDEEGQWAQRVAKHLGISFELSHHGRLLPFEEFQDSQSLFPEPLANPFRAIYLRLYRRSAAKARVVFFGYGGDDVLAGEMGAYLKFMAKRRRLVQACAELAAYLIERRRLPPLRIGTKARLHKWFGFWDDEVPVFPPWLAESFVRELRLRERWLELRQETRSPHPIHPKAFAGLAGGWATVLDREDAAYSGLPLAIRLPLFDFRLLRFLLRLPTLPWCAHKEIARLSMQGRLPESILRRPKRILARDPLELHERQGNWKPLQFDNPTDEVREFVNWPKYIKGGRYQRVADLWRDCTPIGMNLWLKNR